MHIVWQPQPKQRRFMARPEFEALYGGAAGGGKSDALVIEALRQVHIPYYKGLILRKTYPQLAELIDKSLNYYPRAYPGARYNGGSHTWTFPSGAKILFGNLQHAKDKIKYQGQAYDFIAFDELTHFTYEEYSYLFSRCRPNGPGTRCSVRSTANPGNIGHGWVKARFITAAPPGTTICEEVTWKDPAGQEHKGQRTRIFIPSSVFDNQALLRNDPGYVERLAGMPEKEREALLYGNWDSFEGQVFTMRTGRGRTSSGPSASPRAGRCGGASTGAIPGPSPWAGTAWTTRGGCTACGSCTAARGPRTWAYSGSRARWRGRSGASRPRTPT